MLYSRWTTWDWVTGGMPSPAAGCQAMHEMDQAIAALERRMASSRTTSKAGCCSVAVTCPCGASACRAGLPQAAALDGHIPCRSSRTFGEAVAFPIRMGLQGEAGAIFERVLAMSPAHPKGSGTAA
jgi:cytochrome c-type biogenesis protein CcmH